MTFAERLFEELSAVEDGPDFELFCEGFGAMFQPVEDLAGEDDAGNVGYSILLDIDRCPPDALGFLGQFVGVDLDPSLSDADQRTLIRSMFGFGRGRPATIIAAAQSTLTGDKLVVLIERAGGSAWHYKVRTRGAETPDADATQRALLKQKPGPDIMTYEAHNYIDYAWVEANVASYADLESTFTTYADLRDEEI